MKVIVWKLIFDYDFCSLVRAPHPKHEGTEFLLFIVASQEHSGLQAGDELAKTTINEESATPADRNSKPEASNLQACGLLVG